MRERRAECATIAARLLHTRAPHEKRRGALRVRVVSVGKCGVARAPSEKGRVCAPPQPEAVCREKVGAHAARDHLVPVKDGVQCDDRELEVSEETHPAEMWNQGNAPLMRVLGNVGAQGGDDATLRLGVRKRAGARVELGLGGRRQWRRRRRQ